MPVALDRAEGGGASLRRTTENTVTRIDMQKAQLRTLRDLLAVVVTGAERSARGEDWFVERRPKASKSIFVRFRGEEVARPLYLSEAEARDLLEAMEPAAVVEAE